MSGANFRFRPPETPATPALAWVLSRAYGPADTPSQRLERPERSQDALDLARRLGLAARIGARHPPERLTEEVGSHAATELKRASMLVCARELGFRVALEEVDRAAAELGIAYAPLKGLALTLGGYSLPGSRPFSDVDLLVPAARLEALQRELARRGFTVAGRGYEHHAPPLRHPAGGQIELHRSIPGVRIDASRPRRSATFEALLAARLLAAPTTGAFQAQGQLLLPSPELLAAHSLVHVLSQHGFAPGVYPGFLMLADLLDLGVQGVGGRETLAAVEPWIARAVSRGEAAAALDLATSLATGDRSLFEGPRTRARILLDHFHAGATEPSYGESLKTRMFERPTSDRRHAHSRARLLAGALFPAKTGVAAGTDGFAGFSMRPLELWRRWRSARRAARALAGNRR